MLGRRSITPIWSHVAASIALSLGSPGTLDLPSPFVPPLPLDAIRHARSSRRHPLLALTLGALYFPPPAAWYAWCVLSSVGIEPSRAREGKGAVVSTCMLDLGGRASSQAEPPAAAPNCMLIASLIACTEPSRATRRRPSTVVSPPPPRGNAMRASWVRPCPPVHPCC